MRKSCISIPRMHSAPEAMLVFHDEHQVIPITPNDTKPANGDFSIYSYLSVFIHAPGSLVGP
jgi:hypothetical protein